MKRHINNDIIGMVVGTILVLVMLIVIGAAEASSIDDMTITKEDAIGILMNYGIDEKANQFNNNFVTYEELENAFDKADAKQYEFEDELNYIFGIERPEEGIEAYYCFKKHIISVFKKIDKEYGKGACAWYACQAYASISEGDSLGIEYISELSMVVDIFEELYGDGHTELERIRSKAILRYKKLS